MHRSALLQTVTLAGCCLVALTGCDDDTSQRIDRLEAELREVRSDTREQVSELQSRVISAENKVGVSDDGQSFTDRLKKLENSFSEIVSRKTENNEMVYLRPHVQGHAPLRTDHGTFLVRMEGIDLNLETEGYTVHLNIGNPHAIAIQQFTLAGDHGGGTPQLADGQSYNLDNPAIREWQASLQPFEVRVTKTLEPFTWTPFDIELEAESRKELEVLRFTMTVENARLERRDTTGGGGSGGGVEGAKSSFSHIEVEADAASVLRTDYGAFLITVKRSEKTDVGTRLHLEIGNPYGFTINQCRLLGDFGPAVPERADSGSPEEYGEKMQAWSANLEPFEAMISSKLSNFRWNRATILVPGPPERVKFLRCKLRVEDVTLPAAGEPG